MSHRNSPGELQTLVFGLPVLRSATPEETAGLILYAAHQLQRRKVGPP